MYMFLLCVRKRKRERERATEHMMWTECKLGPTPLIEGKGRWFYRKRAV